MFLKRYFIRVRLFHVIGHKVEGSLMINVRKSFTCSQVYQCLNEKEANFCFVTFVKKRLLSSCDYFRTKLRLFHFMIHKVEKTESVNKHG